MIRPPAGYYPLSSMYPWIVVAGQVLICTRCGAEGHAPLPRLHPAEYGSTCEEFLARHRCCATVELVNR